MLATVLSNTLQIKSLSKSCFSVDVGDLSFQLVTEIKVNVSAVNSRMPNRVKMTPLDSLIVHIFSLACF